MLTNAFNIKVNSYAGLDKICIQIRIPYIVWKNCFEVVCKSAAGVKFNSSCIVVIIFSLYIYLSKDVKYLLYTVFSFDGAKLLQQTAKTCHIDVK